MKKGILLGLASLFILTGCGGNKVVCTGKSDSAGISVEAKITATIKNDKVAKVSGEMTFKDEATAKTMCSYVELANSLVEKESGKIKVTCKGKKINFRRQTHWI